MIQHQINSHVRPGSALDVPPLQDPHGVKFFLSVIFLHRDFHFGFFVELDESDPGFSRTEVKLVDDESERVSLVFQFFILNASRNVHKEENVQRFLCAFCCQKECQNYVFVRGQSVIISRWIRKLFV